MIDALHYDFMQNALAAGLLAAVICGIMGSLVVVNRIVFLSGGIAHAAFGGIGMAFFFGWSFLAGTLGFALVAALIMAGITLRAKHRADTIIGVIWAVGMAIGVILLDLTPGYNVDLMSYLFGSILTVPEKDLWIMAAQLASRPSFFAAFSFSFLVSKTLFFCCLKIAELMLHLYRILFLRFLLLARNLIPGLKPVSQFSLLHEYIVCEPSQNNLEFYFP